MQIIRRSLLSIISLAVALIQFGSKADDTKEDPGLYKRVGVATFDKNVDGKVTFSQEDWKSPLNIDVDLSNLTTSGDMYHIHRLPVLTDCVSTGGHYNPLNVSATAENYCETPQLCEAGDLSTKFGPLQKSAEGTFKGDYKDPYLTLYGFNSIIGRSVVIHDPTGKRIACGTIKLDGQPLTAAEAHFTEGLTGNVTFVQPTSNYYADTITYMDLKPSGNNMEEEEEGKPAPAAATTLASKDAVKDGVMNYYIYDGKCDDANSKLYNPLGLKMSCTPEDNSPFQEGCALGDLSGRHGMFTLPITGDKAVFINDYVPLNGPDSIIGKSLVIQGGGENKHKYCANIVASSNGAKLFQ